MTDVRPYGVPVIDRCDLHEHGRGVETLRALVREHLLAATHARFVRVDPS